MTDATTTSGPSFAILNHELRDLDGHHSTNLQPKSFEVSCSVPAKSSLGDGEDGKTNMQTLGIISVLAGVIFISVSGTGILTTSLPTISTEISLNPNLITWPASVYALSAGCMLLAFGSVADVVGSKRMWLLGSGISCPLILACGLAQTGNQFIVFRALLGFFVAMCLPTSMSLVTASFSPGPKRNIAFAVTGMGQPIGYAFGLILGGVLTDTIGWRWGFYITAIANAVLFVASALVLPPDPDSKHLTSKSWTRLRNDIDWVGVTMLSVSFGLLSYVLAMVTTNYKNASRAYIIVLLALSVLLLPLFSLWELRQVNHHRVALIPNALWRKISFTSICLSMFFTWATFNAFQYTSTLLFQQIENISALQTSLRFLPMAVVGVLVNPITALLVAKVNVNTLLGISAVLTAVAPILMATARTEWSYWSAPFVAIALSPVNGDVLWTVSSLVICRAFPDDSHGLAGGVFNTISQLGNSVGLTVTAAIAASVTSHEEMHMNSSIQTPSQLLQGYRAAYWTMFAGMLVVCITSFAGLRNLGKVGVKQD